MKEIKKEIHNVCEKCAAKIKKHLPDGHCASFWQDTCDVCEKETMVADIHDFGYLTESFE